MIGAVKESQKSDFKMLQIDAKVSQGSSGSPMINDNGEAIGIVTYQTSGQMQENGDSFAFAIPIEVGKNFLNEVSVENAFSNYGLHLKAGLELTQNRRCKKAIEEFNLAKKVNGNFAIDSYINPYIEECNSMIAKGESVDSKWDEFREWVGNIGYLGWAIIGGGVVVFIVLIVFIMSLAKKMKGKEKEIGHLEDLMLEEAARENVEREELQKVLKNNGNPAGQAGFGAERMAAGIAAAEAADFNQPVSGKIENITIKNNPPKQDGSDFKPEILPAQPAAEPVIAAIDPSLAAYVRQSREYGLTDETIIQELKKSGWLDSDIQNALAVKQNSI